MRRTQYQALAFTITVLIVAARVCAQADLTDKEKECFENVTPVVSSLEWNKEKSGWDKTRERGIVTAVLHANDQWSTFILTTSHGIPEESRKTGNILVTRCSTEGNHDLGEGSRAKIVSASKKIDLVLLVVESKHELFMSKDVMFVTAPKTEEAVCTGGIWTSESVTVACGNLKPGIFSFLKADPPVETSLLTTCETKPGASGSGIFRRSNDEKKMVCYGILTHVTGGKDQSNPGKAFGLTSDQIHQFAHEEHVEYAFHFEETSAQVAALKK